MGDRARPPRHGLLIQLLCAWESRKQSSVWELILRRLIWPRREGARKRGVLPGKRATGEVLRLLPASLGHMVACEPAPRRGAWEGK